MAERKQQFCMPEYKYLKASEILRMIETFYFTKYGNDVEREIDRPKLINKIAELLPKKEQQTQSRHYIYVARVIIGEGIEEGEERYLVSDLKMVVCKDGGHATHIKSRLISYSKEPPYNIKLKPGEQVRIPILVEKADRI